MMHQTRLRRLAMVGGLLAAALVAGCGGQGRGSASPSNTMPPNVQADLQQKMGSVTGPQPSPGTQPGTAPAPAGR